MSLEQDTNAIRMLRMEMGAVLLISLIGLSGAIQQSSPHITTPIKPNHVPHTFWGSPNPPISLFGVQGSGQLYNEDFVPTRSRVSTVGANVPCIGTPPTSCNQFYCTGMTGGPYTQVSPNDYIAVNAQFAYINLNATLPWEIQFVLNLSTSAPSTTFGAGHCAPVLQEIGNFVVFAQDMAHANSGNMLVFSKQPAGTYYADLEAEVQNEASGKITLPLAGNGPNLSMWDASLIKTPLAGSPSASTNLGTWANFPSGTIPGPETPGEVPSSNGIRLSASLQTQTPKVRLWVGIGVAFPSGNTCVIIISCTSPPNPPSAWIWLQYSTNGGTSWNDICGDDANGLPLNFVDVTQTARPTLYNSGFCTMQSAAFTVNNTFRIVGAGGDDFDTIKLFYLDWEFSP